MKSILGDQNARTEREEMKAIFVIYIESFNIQQFSCSIEAANNHEQFLANSITSKFEVLIRTWFKLSIVLWFQSELFTVESKLLSIIHKLIALALVLVIMLVIFRSQIIFQLDQYLVLGLFTGHGITTIMKDNEHVQNIIQQQYRFTRKLQYFDAILKNQVQANQQSFNTTTIQHIQLGNIFI
ncbi:Hypothetical_protein [Hexamita inflata]|uniref:Hypothetical_protein n=1 Tax=Hexamita inflata TaxID=28002 RepID=A0AA86UF73_9EUKA|nr:Hypothetical protein HINF_LOCUS37171 [Hexamita inflata]